MNMSYEELVARRNSIIGFNPDNINISIHLTFI